MELVWVEFLFAQNFLNLRKVSPLSPPLLSLLSRVSGYLGALKYIDQAGFKLTDLPASGVLGLKHTCVQGTCQLLRIIPNLVWWSIPFSLLKIYFLFYVCALPALMTAICVPCL